jgi:hypothetical protein
MSLSFWRLVAPLATLAVCAFVPAAKADPIVSFSVTGYFERGSVENGILENSGQTLTVGGNTLLDEDDYLTGVVPNVHLDYAGAAFTLDLGLPQYASGGLGVADVSFGSIVARSEDPNGSLTHLAYRQFDGARLVLEFTQTSPVAGNYQVVSKSIHGTLWYNESTGTTAGWLGIKFEDPLEFTIPGDPLDPDAVTYTFVTPTVRINNPDGTNGGPSVIEGRVSAAAAPLPAPALLGAVLLGGFGGLRGLKRLCRGRSVTVAA